MKLVWKLLRQHISIPQFLGFFFANLIGLTIILLGVQFYNDYRALDSGDSFMKADYLIVNKKVSALSSLTGQSLTFDNTEIQELKQQSFVEEVGTFTPSAFQVRARFEMNGLANMATDMFFESVPNEFVDVKNEAWTYQPGQTEISIILPKNYLDLYNFGYAQGKGLPKLSEGILGAIKLHIHIDGNGHVGEFTGRIVGFSMRLNTILVPEAFMQWANRTYGSGETVKSTRLILRVNNPTDEGIPTFLQANNYETDQGKLDASKTTFVLRVIVSIVMTIGLVISILSFYILMLSIFLLVEKNSQKLENLLLLGYSPGKVSLPYQVLTVGLNLLVLLLAFGVMLLSRTAYLTMFESFFPDYESSSILPALFLGLLLLLVVSAFNVVTVRKKVMDIWHHKD